MAADPALADGVADRVRAGASAAHAVHAAFSEYRELLAAAGGYLAERVADLDDVRDRAVAAALGRPLPGVPAPGHPYVLVAEDLAPADTVGLDPAVVLALVTELGSPTSHTAILARSLGLPAVVGCRAPPTWPTGRSSGSTAAPARSRWAWTRRPRAPPPGRPRCRPTTPGRAGPRTAARCSCCSTSARRPTSRRRRGPGRRRALGLAAAEGVGLFRTELLFLDRTEMPGADEQQRAYEELFRAAGGRKVVLRTLDAGADKPLPFLGLRPEPNPALGVRGLRVARVQPACWTRSWPRSRRRPGRPAPRCG